MKDELRSQLRSGRARLDKERAAEAQATLLEEVRPLISIPGWILSFSSRGNEIEMSAVNALLASRGRLVLPRVEGHELSLYVPRGALIANRWGILEPDPDLSPSLSPDEIGVALIPGLGFDTGGGRLGYGMGFYDRLLPRLVRARCLGVGYQEQLVVEPIPLEPHDVSLPELLLC